MEFFIQILRAKVNKCFLKITRKVILLYTCLLYSNLRSVVRRQEAGGRRQEAGFFYFGFWILDFGMFLSTPI
jgi:hypothetical protein